MNTQEEEYVTLFCEGDGHVRLSDLGYPRIVFYQKERNVLDYISSLAANGHVYQAKQRDFGQSDIYSLVFTGKYCTSLLGVFSRCVVGKQFLNRLNEVLGFVNMPPAVQHPLTLDGFVGFWDAEGSSGSIPTLFIGQKDREILDLIVKMFGGGVSCTKSPNGRWHYAWNLYGERARALYKILWEKSHCSSKSGRLRENFEGSRYYEHKDEKRIHNRLYSQRHQLVRNWIRSHPEEVARLLKRSHPES